MNADKVLCKRALPSARRPISSARRRGTALIELALVAPVLLGMLLGIIDFGLLQRNTLVIANAAREGARAAALGQTRDNIRRRIATAGAPVLKADAGGNPTNGTIRMEHAAPANTLSYQNFPNDTTGTNAKNGVPQGNYVRITVSYNHRSITTMFNRTMTIPVTMRREG